MQLIGEAMCELQAVIEFSVALNRFINVDLFNRGYYQIRLSLRIASKAIHRVEVSLFDTTHSTPSIATSTPSQPSITSLSTPSATCSSNSDSECASSDSSIVFPQCVVNGSAVSKTFQILYKNEEVLLNDVVVFKANLIVDANDCIKQINKTSFILDVELWFTDQSFGADHHNSIECVSTRQLLLHFDIIRGLHYYMPVMFDYFHLSTIMLSIHASLITLCQPYLNNLKVDKRFANNVYGSAVNNSSYGYDMLLFGGSSNAKTNDDVMAIRFRRAQLIHWELTSIILGAIHSMKRKLEYYFQLLPPWQQSKYVNFNVLISLDNLSTLAQHCYKSIVLNGFKSSKCFVSFQNEFPITNDLMKAEYFVATVESDMAYLCGLAIVEWQHFLDIVLLSARINQHLAKVHHKQRIKRFSEAFFCIEKPKRHLHSICDNSTNIFNEISESIRKSPYLTLLPSCDVECVALDGDSASLPIIYEEKFESELPEQHYQFNSASISDICLEDTFENLLRYEEPSATLKRNVREKILNNLSRLHLGSYGKLKEYSPTAIKPSANSLIKLDKNMNSQSIKSNAITNDSHSDSVKLLGFRRFDNSVISIDKNQMHKQNSFMSQSTISSSLSYHDIHSQTGKRIVNSESLPNLSTSEVLFHLKNHISFAHNENVAKNVNVSEKSSLNFSIKPPSQFRDSRSVDDKKRDDETSAHIYPKPPKQFILEENDEPEECFNAFSPIERSTSSSNEHEAINGVEMNIEPKQLITHNSMDSECTILEMLKFNNCLLCGDVNCQCIDYSEELPSLRRVSAIGSDLVSFVKAKEEFRKQISSKSKGWLIYSDFASLASRIPYFQCDSDFRSFSAQKEGLHLIICVHGLDGNSADLRLVKTYLELGLPTSNFEFLMSQRNQGETFDSLDTLTDRLVQEINYHIDVFALNPTRISFIGHSLGNIIIRAVLAKKHEFVERWKDKLHTFLSLSGPHLGLAYNNSGLVNMGLWFMQKWKKSGSLLQLAMKDSSDPRQTYLYRLSLESGLEYFRNILLCGSSQDHYVPIHSAHIELCSAALNDSSLNGVAYREMVNNLLFPLMNKSGMKLIRYDVHHSLASNANSLIGRAAHIAVLDSELFIEKFMVVTGLKYFM